MDTTQGQDAGSFVFGPAGDQPPMAEDTLPPATDLWASLMLRWIGEPPEPPAPMPEQPSDIWG
jgi:hypothetical protein